MIPRGWKGVAVALGLVPALAAAQPLPLADQLPAWAAGRWAAASAANDIELCGALNPFSVAKEGAASALIRYRDRSYVWRQQGD